MHPADTQELGMDSALAIPPIPDDTPLSTAPGSGQSTPPDDPERNDTITFTPRRAMASFENLVALANHQERLRGARKMVWRDKGEPVVELDGLGACLQHAAKGGFRSGLLAFNIRACVNLVLALLRMKRVPRDYRFAMIRHALFGKDTWRFAAMLGTFTSLYKFLINALPILIPAINPRRMEESSRYNRDSQPGGPSLEDPTSTLDVALPKRKARLSLSAHAQLVFLRKRTRRWHAALAGGVAGGLAIIWEKRNRRTTIAQQLFVRGLQGSYNSFTTRHNIHIPHGDVFVFAMVCGQIMYAFLLRPDTLPRSYRSWLSQAAKVPPQCVRINHGLVRENTFDIRDVDQLRARPDTTAANLVNLEAFQELFFPSSSTSIPTDTSTYYPKYAPCSTVHPTVTSCSAVPLDRFFDVFKWMLPIYSALHFVPAILFKQQAFIRDPAKVLVRAGLGSLRSSAFLGVFVVIYQTLFCYKHNLHRFLTELKRSSSMNPLKNVPQFVIDFLISKPSFWLPGFAAGMALFVEEKRRRGELAMYVLPKGLESLWIAARGKGLVFRTGKWGDTLLTTIGMGMVMSTYQNDPQHLSGLVRRIMYQFIGPN
ncbi:hypothetical protein AX17_006496 [Amanita inopinata Kibby_2008]|nr:hypothetical protein AX17_006496 [Amanita inopinata Kibby_2008]